MSLKATRILNYCENNRILHKLINNVACKVRQIFKNTHISNCILYRKNYCWLKTIVFLLPLFLVGCGPWVLKLQHPDPGGRFCAPKKLRNFRERSFGIYSLFHGQPDVRDESCSLTDQFECRYLAQGDTVWRQIKGAQNSLHKTIVYEEGVVNQKIPYVIKVCRGSQSVYWKLPKDFMRLSGWNNVVCVSSKEMSGLVRVDLLVQSAPRHIYQVDLFYRCVVFGKNNLYDYDWIKIGNALVTPGLFIKYLDDGGFQLTITQSAFWGIPFIFPIPVFPIPFWGVSNGTVLKEKESIFTVLQENVTSTLIEDNSIRFEFH